MSKQVNGDLASLLDGTLDGLSDRPSFKPFPKGAHRCKIGWEPKVVKDVGSGVELSLVVIKTEELENPGDAPCDPGDKTKMMFFFTHAQEFVWQNGQGQFKELMANVAEKLGPGSPRELMAKSNGMEAIVVTGVRSNKEKTQEYTVIEDFELLA